MADIGLCVSPRLQADNTELDLMNLRLTLALLAVVQLAACTTPAERLNQQVALVPEADRSYMIGNYAVDCEPGQSSCTHDPGKAELDQRLHARRQHVARLHA